MTHVELQQAKERFLELIELAASGEEVVISRDKNPLVKLISIHEQKRQRRFGSARGLIKLGPDFDEPIKDLEEYM